MHTQQQHQRNSPGHALQPGCPRVHAAECVGQPHAVVKDESRSVQALPVFIRQHKIRKCRGWAGEARPEHGRRTVLFVVVVLLLRRSTQSHPTRKPKHGKVPKQPFRGLVAGVGVVAVAVEHGGLERPLQQAFAGGTVLGANVQRVAAAPARVVPDATPSTPSSACVGDQNPLGAPEVPSSIERTPRSPERTPRSARRTPRQLSRGMSRRLSGLVDQLTGSIRMARRTSVKRRVTEFRMKNSKAIQAASAHRCIVFPYDPRVLRWDKAMIIALLFTVFVTPFEAAFLKPELGVLFWINRAVDVFFWTVRTVVKSFEHKVDQYCYGWRRFRGQCHYTCIYGV